MIFHITKIRKAYVYENIKHTFNLSRAIKATLPQFPCKFNIDMIYYHRIRLQL